MKILGIELGGRSVKAVEMETRFRKVEVLDTHEIKLPLKFQDSQTQYRLAVRDLFARLPANPDKVVVSLPSVQIAHRFFQVPIKQRKKVEQSYRLELEDNIPFKLEEAIVEHHITPLKEGSLVFASIAPKKHLVSYLEWLKEVGIDPDWIVFEGMGAINLFLTDQAKNKKDKKQSQDAKFEGPSLLLDMGHLCCNVSIYEEDILEYVRTITWGGLNLSESIGNALGISLEEAEEKKKHLNLSQPFSSEDLEIAVNKALGGLLADLTHSMVSYRAQYKKEIKKVYLTGGLSLLSGLDVFLTQALGVPVVTYDPWGSVPCQKTLTPEQKAVFTESLGRAFVFARQSELLFNFRQDEVSKETSLNELTDFLRNPNTVTLLKYSSMAVSILIVSFWVMAFIEEGKARKSQEELSRKFGEVFSGVTKKQKALVVDDPAHLRTFLDSKSKEIQQKLKLLDKGKLTAINFVKSVSEAFPPTIKVDVNIIQFDRKEFKLEGVLFEGSVQSVVDKLKQNPAYDQVKLELQGQRFVIEGKVLGG